MHFMTVKLQRFNGSNRHILQQKLNTLPIFVENMAKIFLTEVIQKSYKYQENL